MTIWEYKNCIKYRVNKLNELTKETYEIEYGNGGCLLYKYVNNCPVSGKFGDASIRRKLPEMLAYLDGLISGLTNTKF